MNTTFNDEEDLALNVSSIINDYLTKGNPIDYITKHFFYAKNLISVLAKHNIPFKVTHLGAGVRRITALSPSTDFANVTKLDIWKKYFGTTPLSTTTVYEIINKNNELKDWLFPQYSFYCAAGLGGCLNKFQEENSWLKKESVYVASTRQHQAFWSVS